METEAIKTIVSNAKKSKSNLGIEYLDIRVLLDKMVMIYNGCYIHYQVNLI
jgi:hypothetical protein